MRLGLSLGPGSGSAAGGGGGGISSPTDVFLGTATEGWWPTSGADNLFTTTDKSTPSTDGGVVGAIENQVVAGADLLQATSTHRPVADAASGLLSFDADSLRNLDITLATRTADYVYMFVMSTTDTAWIKIYDSGTVYVGSVADASASTTLNTFSGTPTYWKNGVQFSGTTRDDLHTFYATGSKVIVELRGLNLTDATWGATQIFSSFIGLAGDFALFENPGDTELTQIREFLAARHSITI